MAGLLSVLEPRQRFSRRDRISTKGLCPDDDDDVQCCLIRECTVPQGKGYCRSKEDNGCPGGEFFPGTGDPWPCPGPNDIQCCVKKEDITSAEPSTTQKTKDSTKTTTETRETSSKITITSESSDEPSTTSSTSSSSSPSSSTLTSSSLFFSTVTVTPSPVSTSSIPQTISSTSLLPSQTTTQPVSDSNRKLSSAQLGGIAVGSIAAGFTLILFIIFILMRIARARHNKKIAREATMRSKNRAYMRMGTEYDNDKHSPVGNGAGEGYELEPRPAYRPFRPHHAEAMVELDGSPTTREKERR
uniref:Uncharacterized protein n=1 Tax=Coccidioides posadasii RMSCC 3488 TaxID=454284 RepID=A0A0J6FVZ2_COCPO|nr:hypothetical protein CPAG_09653 [Coccidioides posadasii RMSCC 3488]